MRFIDIKNPKFITSDNRRIDITLVTDEGELPFTYDPDDEAPASQWIKSNLVLSSVAPYEPPPLSYYQAKKVKEIKLAWDRQIHVIGMPTGIGFNVDCDIDDALIWEQGVNFLDPSVETVRVRAIDNTFHYITREAYSLIPDLQKQFYAFCLQKKWNLQEQANNATSLEELSGVYWNLEGWGV